jgi:hypothetical protein
MGRTYVTSPTMLHDKYSDKVVQPDMRAVETLHKLLNMITDDRLAVAIDMVVADLIRFHNPQHGMFEPELIMPATPTKENLSQENVTPKKDGK